MRLSSILGISWDELSDKLLKDFLFRARHFVSSLILTLTNSHGDNLVDLNIGGNSEQVSPYNVRSVSGTAVRLDDSYSGEIKNVIQYGQCVQDGTPTPAAPIAITGKAAGASVYGKNFLDISGVTPTALQRITAVISGNKLTETSTDSESGWHQCTLMNAFPVFDGQCRISANVAFTYSTATPVLTVAFYNSEDVRLRYANVSASNGTASLVVTIPNGTAYANMAFIMQVSKTTQSVAAGDVCEWSDIQVEVGSTATAYEPYTAPITQTVTDANGDPVTLYGLPVPSGGNVTIDGQQYIADTLEGTTVTRRVGHIASYNGETVTTAYISSTGELSTGAAVYYVLATSTTETVTLSPTALAANSPTTTWLSDAHSTFELPVTGQGNVTLPNPSWPVPIENVGTLMTEGEHVGKYAIPVKVSGKNIMPDSEWRIGELYGLIDGTSTALNAGYNSNTAYIPVSGGVSYIYTQDVAVTNWRIYQYTADKAFIRTDYLAYGTAKTSEANARYIRIAVFKAGGTVAPSNYQLELGSTATAYEPYHEPVNTTIYLDEPLRKGDTLEVVGGTLVKRRALLDLGSLNWTMPLDYFRAVVENTMKPFSSGFCELFPVKNTALNANPNKTLIIDGDSRVFMRDSDYADAEEFKSAMSGVMLEYELETPVTINLAGQTIPTFEGTTIITVDTDPEPETMTATYWQEG